jgi:hypothetical protein
MCPFWATGMTAESPYRASQPAHRKDRVSCEVSVRESSGAVGTACLSTASGGVLWRNEELKVNRGGGT